MIFLNKRLNEHIRHLTMRYPDLDSIRDDIVNAFLLMRLAYEHDGKLLIAGNGGSASDSEHFAGELMKRFRISRPLPEDLVAKLKETDALRGEKLSKELELGLTAIPLVAHEALTTAYINDVNGEGIFAQQLLGFGQAGDVFLAISTSGTSENIISAAVVAKALDIKVIGLTGSSGGELASIADVCVKAPASETYQIQEYHLPIYHCWAMMLEDLFYG